jgi:hypothetical protein
MYIDAYVRTCTHPRAYTGTYNINTYRSYMHTDPCIQFIHTIHTIHTHAHNQVTVAWAETFGDGQSSNSDFMLASCCQYVFMQPLGTIGITGVGTESQFYAGFLKK